MFLFFLGWPRSVAGFSTPYAPRFTEPLAFAVARLLTEENGDRCFSRASYALFVTHASVCTRAFFSRLESLEKLSVAE